MQKSVNSLVLRKEKAIGGLVEKVCSFLSRYVVLPPDTILVISAWVLAAWLIDIWDRFPHLALRSPAKRCGKTRVFDILKLILPNVRTTCDISLAALYRVIQKERPTLLIDEAEGLGRRASESSKKMRGLLNAGIDPDATVIRSGRGNPDDIEEFHVYSPKAIALIGELDGVLADRCLLVDMKRKTMADTVERYYSRNVKPIGKELHDEIKAWAAENTKQVAEVYEHLVPFSIGNDRMAELLMPSQAVLQVADPDSLKRLESYAIECDKRGNDTMSSGEELLAACREILMQNTAVMANGFIPTKMLLKSLLQRDWEPWYHWSQGRAMTPRALGDLLGQFDVRPCRNREQTVRGFVVRDFQEAWSRYLQPIPSGKASEPSSPSTRKRRKPR